VELLAYQLEDHKVWKKLKEVDLEDIDDTSVPPLDLLNYLKDRKEANPKEVPYVELMTLCVPEWST
jgi:hypothetical protein